jgi:hypothetical protein
MRYSKKQAINNDNKITYYSGLKKIIEVNQENCLPPDYESYRGTSLTIIHALGSSIIVGYLYMPLGHFSAAALLWRTGVKHCVHAIIPE